MLLEDILQRVNEILIVESLPFDAEAVEKQRMKVAKELFEIYEKHFSVEVIYYHGVSAYALAKRSNPLVIFNAQDDSSELISISMLVQMKKISERLKSASPSSEYLVFNNLGDLASRGNSVRKALEIILSSFGLKDDGFLDHLIGKPALGGWFKRRTILEYLGDELGGIRHSVGAKKDAAFLSELSERFAEGNCQTSTNKTFLIVSNRLASLAGKFEVVSQDADFSSVDFSRYAAIVVDNNYSFKDCSSKLGRGIKVLERLSNLGIGLPVIYQTAHSLENFSDADFRAVHAFENVILIPKNCAFKICKPAQARKELALSEIVKGNPLLSRYCVHAYLVGENGFVEHDGQAILVTKAVQNVPDMNLFADKLGSADNFYAHRAAVLAALHTRMKDEVANPAFSSTIDYLRPWEVVAQGLEHAGFRIAKQDNAEGLYRHIKESHEREPATTIIHNDPKWDNWFKDCVLGDFSDCGPGTEYKDLARAFFDKEENFRKVCDYPWLSARIADYLSARKQLDPLFEPADNFAAKVRELIFVEALRLARFEAQTKDNEHIVRGLLTVASHHQEALRDSYRTIPSRGERAP